jgi:N-acetylglucosaminyl-diphospho-decaprenol L-rhamnosyltransferase
MSAMSTEIAVIIVNYGTADLAIEALESVRARRHGGRGVEIHLVDNASPGGDAAALRAAHGTRGWGDGVVLHLESVNHGFGRGNNVVLRELAARARPPEKVMLLNPDARLDNETLDILAAFLDSHPDAGAAGSTLILPDGTPISAAFRFPSLISELERAALFGPVSRLLGRFRTSLPPDLPTSRVDWVSGASVMFRFRALQAVGFFDPAYFLYYEEVDLMRALHAQGWESWHVSDARSVHHEAVATGVAKRSGRRRRPDYVYESWRYYFLKNHGRGYALCAACIAMAGGALHVATSALRGRESWLPRNYFGDCGRVALDLLLGRDGSAPTDRPRSA